MKQDLLQQFVALRAQLHKEKSRVEARLEAINHALDCDGFIPSTTVQTRPIKPRLNRVKNRLSLRQAILQATATKALTKPEILDAIRKLGYVFTTVKPMNSINFVLYGKNPKFHNQAGKFRPVK